MVTHNCIRRRLQNIALLMVSALVAASTNAAPRDPAVPVILVSIDGFRPDYLDRGVTPNLNALAAGGARAIAMRPSFPSVTFPNHYTLVTGLRPDRSGMVDNTMEDAAIPGVRFSMSNSAAVTDRRWWDQGEPIWVTAENHGIRAGTMFWPGSEAAIHDVRPTETRTFNGKLPPNDRVDTLLAWLDRPAAERLGFLTLYFDDVDHAGHEFGPDDKETTAAAAHVDQAIGRLLDGLKSRQVAANLVVVSDHGMAQTSVERVVRMDLRLPAGSYRFLTGGSIAGIEATAGNEDALAAALLQPQPHVQCWRKADIPARYFYGKNPRVPGFFCLAEPGWAMDFSERKRKRATGGAHGYDNQVSEMRATFIANGPAFKPGVVLPIFDNVDVYPLLMRLLDLTPLPSDGTIAPLLPALNDTAATN